MAAGRLATLPFAALLLIAGCLSGDRPATTDHADDGHDHGAPMANATRKEMYIVATDVGANPESVFKLHPRSFTFDAHDALLVTLKGAVGNQYAHNLVAEGLDVRITGVPAGEARNATAMAHKAGTFKFYCDVGQHRLLGMEGTLTVRG